MLGEDVTEIIMNIKSLALRNTSDSEEAKTAYIDSVSTIISADLAFSDRSINRLRCSLKTLAARRRCGQQALHGADHYQRQGICEC